MEDDLKITSTICSALRGQMYIDQDWPQEVGGYFYLVAKTKKKREILSFPKYKFYSLCRVWISWGKGNLKRVCHDLCWINIIFSWVYIKIKKSLTKNV